jgi:CheY-like chemotaxis protein
MIEKSGKRMLRTINDIIDISKIEAGQMDINVSQVNINQQFDFVLHFFTPEAKAKGLGLKASLSLPDSKALFYTDQDKFYAILSNLVKNAIKYTVTGSVVFGYEVNENILKIYVQDTGMGIAKNRQQAIFDRFVQADVADKMALEGSGLGLTITKAFTEMLGGHITIESQEGVGSIFRVFLPVKSNAEEFAVFLGEQQEMGHGDAEALILIVEDEPISEKFFDAALRKTSYNLLHAHSGDEAIELCKQNPGIDLILMDIKMPGMSGYEASQQIRGFNKDVIIIAQTAYCQTGERTKAIEAGCNDYLTKPISTPTLLAVLKKHLSAAR